jgi:hypothetical protein
VPSYLSKAEESDAFLLCPCSLSRGFGLFGGAGRRVAPEGVGRTIVPFGLCRGVTLVSSGVMIGAGVTEADLIGFSSAFVLAT